MILLVAQVAGVRHQAVRRARHFAISAVAVVTLVVGLPMGAVPAPTAGALPQQHAVTTWVETWVDASRVACRLWLCGPRTLVTHMWAPADGGGYPIVVFAHGFDVDPDHYALFLSTVAAAGYVVVAPELPEATSNGPCCPSRPHTAAQAGDVSFALTQALAEAASPGTAFAGLASADNPLVMGHSDGGTVAAAVLSSDVTDPRFAGGVVIAGAEDSDVSGWGPHTGRVLVVHGDADAIDPIALAQPVYDDTASPKAFLVGAGRSHEGVILDADADGARQAIIGWADAVSRFDVSGLGRLRSWGTSPGWYLDATDGLSWSPFGVIDQITGGTLSVAVSGWTMDADTFYPIDVDVWIDSSVTDVGADDPRPDVGAIFKNGADHGFSVNVPAEAGSHTVCVWAHNVGAGLNVELGCQVVTVAAPPPPSAPAGLIARPYHGSASLWWAANAGAEQVTGYRVTCSCGSTKDVTTTATSFGGLPDGVPVTFTVQAINAGGSSPASMVSVTPADLSSGLLPVAPTRLLDTRTTGDALGPRSLAHLSLAPPVGAVGAVVAVTAVDPTAPTHLTVGPTHEVPGDVSSLNVDPGVGPVANQVVVPLGADGGIDVYNNSGTTHVLVDLMGWMTTGAGTLARQPITSQRLIDTRTTATPMGPGTTITLSVGHANAAVGLVITSTNATQDSFLTAWGPGARPLASIQNPHPGLDRAANVIVPVDANGQVHLFNNSGTTDLVVDLVGAYGTSGSSWHPQAPWRLYDSRAADGPLTPGTPRQLPATVPLQANLVGVQPATAGFVTAWGDGPWPGTSNLNVPAGGTVAQQVVAGDANGLQLLANVPTQVVVDVSGEWR